MPTGATMDFFAHQENARRRTGLLVFFFGCAVVLIVLAIYFAVWGGLDYLARNSEEAPVPMWNPDLLLLVSLVTLGIVGIGSVVKIAQLAGGGKAIAELLGGRPVSPDTTDPAERRLLNVVEEMAIASGTRVPDVYVLDNEGGINAFAAGFGLRDAVVAVTRGSLEQLSRDELQGVIAHEFSHILNGDMRLNIKLTGVLHGILVIALIGYGMMQLWGHSGARPKKKDDSDGLLMAIFVLGLGLYAIGYIGVFFANIIKSAVSRQREFLADASAVQFTRNPEGIAGALKKIGGLVSGSRIQNTHASEAGHFFFSNGLGSSFAAWMATHPPLKERIERILQHPMEALMPAPPPVPSLTGAEGLGGMAAAAPAHMYSSQKWVERTGMISPERVVYAQHLLNTMPDTLRTAARAPGPARVLTYALLMSEDAAVLERQRARLQDREGAAAAGAVMARIPEVRALDPAQRLPLAELCIHTLRSLPIDAAQAFTELLEQIIVEDEEVDLFEFTLMCMVRRHAGAAGRRRADPPIRYRRLAEVRASVSALLSSIARWDAGDDAAARAAFTAAVQPLEGGAGMSLEAASGLESVGRALEAVEFAAPAVKRDLMAACVRCVESDGRVSIEEAQLLRAIADAMDIPLPPPLPSAQAA